MRNLYRIGLILVLLILFGVAFVFVTANTQLVTLDLLVAGWQWRITVGALVILILALGLVVGLCAGLGLRGLKGLFGTRS